MSKIIEFEQDSEREFGRNGKRNVLIREDLEYTAKKMFTYGAVILIAISIYGTFAYITASYLKNK